MKANFMPSDIGKGQINNKEQTWNRVRMEEMRPSARCNMCADLKEESKDPTNECNLDDLQSCHKMFSVCNASKAIHWWPHLSLHGYFFMRMITGWATMDNFCSYKSWIVFQFLCKISTAFVDCLNSLAQNPSYGRCHFLLSLIELPFEN